MPIFKNNYQYEWSNTEEISNLLAVQNAAVPLTITFTTPTLYCKAATSTGTQFQNLFEMNVKTTVRRIETHRTEFGENWDGPYVDVPGTEIEYAVFYSGPTSIPNADNAVYYANNGTAYLRRIKSSRRSYADKTTSEAGDWSDYYTTGLALAQVQQGINSKTITLNIPALTAAEIEAGKGYRFTITCAANPVNANTMLEYYEATMTGGSEIIPVLIGTVTYYWWDIYTSATPVVDSSTIRITTSFEYKDMSVTTIGGPLIASGEKYSCYNLLRKALLTLDTHILDNRVQSLDEFGSMGNIQPSLEHAIIVDNEWNNRLKTAIAHETILEQKNLWEVLLQIGYYIHAIPYLEFADDETDRFILKFRQLGGTRTKTDNSGKITVFNSRNLSEYFTQYESYVTNLFSPQNIVDEWVVAKTSDPSFLISNNTAEIQLSYSVLAIEEFDISLQLPDGNWDTRSALDMVFEKSIYDILSNANPYDVYPSKGAALYYVLGDNKIQGLNFVPPGVNSGDQVMALKRILQLVWQGTDIGNIDNIKFNNLMFHVKFHTQDTVRFTQFRPDLAAFVRNSTFEKYPHHEQFFGQQDKIVDSERFSQNLFGKLIRVGNGIYQRQEYAMPENEKESGDMVTINGEAYYVTETENECYPDAIFQKVTYSKNFNQLANIVTIPSEPRFYEVSERSKIRREVRLMDFFTLSTQRNTEAKPPRFLSPLYWRNFIKWLVFNKPDDPNNPPVLPNYAWTRFKADKLRLHTNSSGFVISNDQLFPSSLIDRTDPNEIHPKDPSDHSDCTVPLLHFPTHDGIIFEWDMADNFKAGDFVDTPVEGQVPNGDNSTINEIIDAVNSLLETGKLTPLPDDTADASYLSMQPLRYCDVMGRADLFEFRLFNKTDWTFEEAQTAIMGTDKPAVRQTVAGGGNDNLGIALDKDAREAISFNYQINFLHKASEADVEDFITFPNLFGQKESELKMLLLSEPQSLFNENINLSGANVVADNVVYELLDDGQEAIELRITQPDGIDLSQVQAIALYQENQQGSRYAYIVKNVSKLADVDKLQSWWIYPEFIDGASGGLPTDPVEETVTFPYTGIVFDVTSFQMQVAPPPYGSSRPPAPSEAEQLEYISIPLAGTPLDGIEIIELIDVSMEGYRFNDDAENVPAVVNFIQNNVLYIRLKLADADEWYRFHNQTSASDSPSEYRRSKVNVTYTTSP